MRSFYPNKENSCERWESQRAMFDAAHSAEKSKLQAPVFRGDPTKFNDPKSARCENFLTWVATPFYQAGICVLSFHVWYFQTSWTWYGLCDRLRSTQLAAVIVNEVCTAMWHQDSLHHSLQPAWLPFPQGFSTWVRANYLLGCFISMGLRRKIFCSLPFLSLLPKTHQVNC